MLTNRQSILSKLLNEISNDIGATLTPYSDSWVYDLQYLNEHHIIYGYRFGSNTDSVSLLCNDKSALSEFLSKHKIPNIKHTYLPSPSVIDFMDNDKEFYCNKVKAMIKNGACVIKVNDGTGGRNVYKVDTFEEASLALEKIYKNGCATICKFEKIQEEIRIIVNNKKVLLIYRKEKGSNWKHNLCLGAKPIVINDTTNYKEALDIVDKIFQLLNIGSASIDIVKVDNRYYLLEINSGVVMENFANSNGENYEIAKSIYKQIIKGVVKKNING